MTFNGIAYGPDPHLLAARVQARQRNEGCASIDRRDELLRMNGASDRSAALAPHWLALIIVLPTGFAGQNLNRERRCRVAQSPDGERHIQVHFFLQLR